VNTADQSGSKDRRLLNAESESSFSPPAGGAVSLEAVATVAPKTIVVIERNSFFRDCLVCSIGRMCPSSSVLACASLSEMQGLGCDPSSTVVLLSIMSLTQREIEAEFDVMTGCDRRQRTMVLAETDNLDEALSALRRGANGYISTSAGLEVFIHALHFVAVGGTYVPAQCVLLARSAEAPVATLASPGSLTGRECAVIQAIRQGKPNKVIAYELNMCESTVKVHVRHIMKKLRAKNRTDVAIKAADLAPTPSIGANGALSSLGFAKRASMI